MPADQRKTSSVWKTGSRKRLDQRLVRRIRQKKGNGLLSFALKVANRAAFRPPAQGDDGVARICRSGNLPETSSASFQNTPRHNPLVTSPETHAARFSVPTGSAWRTFSSAAILSCCSSVSGGLLSEGVSVSVFLVCETSAGGQSGAKLRITRFKATVLKDVLDGDCRKSSKMAASVESPCGLSRLSPSECVESGVSAFVDLAVSWQHSRECRRFPEAD